MSLVPSCLPAVNDEPEMRALKFLRSSLRRFDRRQAILIEYARLSSFDIMRLLGLGHISTAHIMLPLFGPLPRREKQANKTRGHHL